jgi:hypothetical protein
MSESESAQQRAARVMTELKVSGHLMTLDPGLYCIVQNPSRPAEAASGLPGVRLSLPPGPLGRPEAVTIRGFRDDGWLQGAGDAALVRVAGGAAQVLVTIYQSPNADAALAPSLQVVRLLEPAVRAGAGAPAPAAQPVPVAPQKVDVLAHVQGQGDIGGKLGAWIGERGSKRWVEGFAIAPTGSIPADDIEYQAVLGRGWLSPWVEGGQFCGSRGMALPILGLRVQLRGATANTHECLYTATFVDGTSVGPVNSGEACEAESLAPVEAFSIVIRPRATDAAAAAPAPASKPLASKALASKPLAPKPLAPGPLAARAAAGAPAPAAIPVPAPAGARPTLLPDLEPVPEPAPRSTRVAKGKAAKAPAKVPAKKPLRAKRRPMPRRPRR